MRGVRLCVVGNINRDVKAAPVEDGARLLQDGETGVEWIRETVGGGAANSAFAAAALGADVTFVGKVGADGLGARLERTLIAHGLAPRLARSSGIATGTSLALAFRGGTRHFVSCLPASRSLKFEDIDLSALEGAAHLFRGDVWFSEPMLYGGNRRLFEEAGRRGIPVSIDLNWDPEWGVSEPERIRDRKAAVRDLLDRVTVAHGNIRELCEFADAPDLATALDRLTRWGAGSVVVHMGSAGAGHYENGRLETAPPAPVVRVVHSAGCGDVLSVCMMLLHGCPGAPPLERLRLSNQIAAGFMEGRLELIPELAD
jgi:2-dehydro-3-deoxygluconokinase